MYAVGVKASAELVAVQGYNRLPLHTPGPGPVYWGINEQVVEEEVLEDRDRLDFQN